MLVHRLEGPAHAFRTCIASLYASPSPVSRAEPTEVNQKSDAANNKKHRQVLTKPPTTASLFVKHEALNLREITRDTPLRAVPTTNQPATSLVKCVFQRLRRNVDRTMGVRNEARVAVVVSSRDEVSVGNSPHPDQSRSRPSFLTRNLLTVPKRVSRGPGWGPGAQASARSQHRHCSLASIPPSNPNTRSHLQI
jgi:hypothetical protein